MQTMEVTAPDITILYGSQTGNAEDMAKRIGLMAKSRGFTYLRVLSIDDFELRLLPKQRLVLFVCSTTGHGQEPENMKNFYNFIRRRDLPPGCLNGLKFVVYGLGSSSYAKFNYVSKIIYKRMKECGAEPVQELVASDEQHQFGCDGLIYPKLEELWKNLDSLANCSPELKDEEFILNSNSYTVSFYAEDDCHTPQPQEPFDVNFKTKYDILDAKCTINRRLTSETHFQDTRWLCFQSDHDINYEPGDVATIYPQNLEENIAEFLQLLNLNPEQRFKIRKRDSNYMINYLYDFIPDGLKVQDLVRHYLDIQSVPKRSFFERLWIFSDDQLERDKLKEFASTEGQSELYDYCTRPKRSILETMLDFPNTIKNIKFEHLFDLIPPIKPRSFSIASAICKHPNEIQLLVGVVDYKTSMRKTRRGLCSNYLARLSTVDQQQLQQCPHPNECKLRFFIRKTAFKLPSDASVPIIMVGPGLGLSPFRSFIEHRAAMRQRTPTTGGQHLDQTAAACHLYFGCRFSDRDYYFRDELEQYSGSNLISLRVAYSRELGPGQHRRYVQDLLAEDGELIRELIRDHGAVVYVAGNSKLPEELRSLLGKLLTQQTGDSSSEASHEVERMVSNLEVAARIQYDCW